MTTNQTNIPEPTSRTEVVVGKRNGETVVAVLDHDDDYPWVVQTGDHRHCWRSWTGLCRDLTDIRVVDLAGVASEIARLKARIAELEGAPALSDEQVEALRECDFALQNCTLRDAFPDVFEPEPEPSADIPDEVVDAAFDRLVAHDGDAWGLAQSDKRRLRLALAAADAKRAELEEKA